MKSAFKLDKNTAKVGIFRVLEDCYLIGILSCGVTMRGTVRAGDKIEILDTNHSNCVQEGLLIIRMDDNPAKTQELITWNELAKGKGVLVEFMPE